MLRHCSGVDVLVRCLCHVQLLMQWLGVDNGRSQYIVWVLLESLDVDALFECLCNFGC